MPPAIGTKVVVIRRHHSLMPYAPFYFVNDIVYGSSPSRFYVAVHPDPNEKNEGWLFKPEDIGIYQERQEKIQDDL